MPTLAMQNRVDITHEETEEQRSEEMYSRRTGTLICPSAAMVCWGLKSILTDATL
jgi:hypothetical protein